MPNTSLRNSEHLVNYFIEIYRFVCSGGSVWQILCKDEKITASIAIHADLFIHIQFGWKICDIEPISMHSQPTSFFTSIHRYDEECPIRKSIFSLHPSNALAALAYPSNFANHHRTKHDPKIRKHIWNMLFFSDPNWYACNRWFHRLQQGACKVKAARAVLSIRLYQSATRCFIYTHGVFCRRLESEHIYFTGRNGFGSIYSEDWNLFIFSRLVSRIGLQGSKIWYPSMPDSSVEYYPYPSILNHARYDQLNEISPILRRESTRAYSRTRVSEYPIKLFTLSHTISVTRLYEW